MSRLNDYFRTEQFRQKHVSRVDRGKPDVRIGKYAASYLTPEYCRSIGAPAILEIACGAGQATAFFSKMFPSYGYVGMDFSEVMLEEARRRYPNRSFRQFEFVDKLPFPDSSFDLVYFFEFTEHVADPHALILEALRVARRAVLFNIRLSNLFADVELVKSETVVRMNLVSWPRLRSELEEFATRDSGLRVRATVIKHQRYRSPYFQCPDLPHWSRLLDESGGARKVDVLIERTNQGFEVRDETRGWEHRGFLTRLSPSSRFLQMSASLMRPLVRHFRQA